MFRKEVRDPMPDTEAASALREARGLIEQGWTKGVLKRPTAKGLLKGFFSGGPTEFRYCTMGAIYQASPHQSLSNRMTGYLAEALGHKNFMFGQIVPWNDHPDRTKADVLAAFDKAIVIAESRMGAARKEWDLPKVKFEVPDIKYNWFVGPAQFMTNEEIISRKKKIADVPTVKKLDVLSDTREFVNSLREEAVI